MAIFNPGVALGDKGLKKSRKLSKKAAGVGHWSGLGPKLQTDRPIAASLAGSALGGLAGRRKEKQKRTPTVKPKQLSSLE